MKEIHSHTLDYHNPLSLYSAGLKNRKYSQILHSSDTEHNLGRYSFIVYDPIEIIKYQNGKISIESENENLNFTGNPFMVIKDRLEILCNSEPAETKENIPPFQGGAVGFFGYDLARINEDLPKIAQYDPQTPEMIIGIYDKVIAYDHIEQKCWIITRGNSSAQAKNLKNKTLEEINLWLRDIPKYPTIINNNISLSWKQEESKQEYIEKIKKIIDYIYDGEIFQANLSQKFTSEITPNFDSFMHYCHLCNINPAPFSAYLNFDEIIISSASPERFLFVHNNNVETRPIKGTRKRAKNFMQDHEIAEELRRNSKDRAENAMIVDLMRNDISKICNDHSVETTKLCAVETFATVHHLVSTVKGRLRGNMHALDLLDACFPGGSITGAPKIRAMEIIEELETSRRNSYCGSIAYIGFDGTMDTNIAIRTISYSKNEASIRAGGGIIAKSNPENEYQETLDKADAMLKSFSPDENLEKTA